MKKLISLILVAAILFFLSVTNPTTEEFADWYARQTETQLGTDSTVFDQLLSSFSGFLAGQAQRDNYGICSVFTYNGQKTLGIGLMFFPLEPLNEQAEDLRSIYADWLESIGR